MCIHFVAVCLKPCLCSIFPRTKKRTVLCEIMKILLRTVIFTWLSSNHVILNILSYFLYFERMEREWNKRFLMWQNCSDGEHEYEWLPGVRAGRGNTGSFFVVIEQFCVLTVVVLHEYLYMIKFHRTRCPSPAYTVGPPYLWVPNS